MPLTVNKPTSMVLVATKKRRILLQQLLAESARNVKEKATRELNKLQDMSSAPSRRPSAIVSPHFDTLVELHRQESAAAIEQADANRLAENQLRDDLRESHTESMQRLHQAEGKRQDSANQRFLAIAQLAQAEVGAQLAQAAQVAEVGGDDEEEELTRAKKTR